jgi:hypothetical protein
MTALADDAMDEKACVGDRRRYESLISGGVAAIFSENIRPSELRFVSAVRKETRVWRTGVDGEGFPDVEDEDSS